MFFPRISSSTEKKVTVSPDNRITIFIWLPKIEDEATDYKAVHHEIQQARTEHRRADVNVGHVTMATSDCYVSVWPAERAGGDRFKVVNAAYSDLITDIRSEGGAPDRIICLYSLDTQAITAAYKDIQASDAGFALAGNNSYVQLRNGREGYNCNGLVYALLQRGGIDKITPFGADSALSLYISPDKFDTYIQSVKARELELYPETQSYPRIAGEYQPPVKHAKTLCTC